MTGEGKAVKGAFTKETAAKAGKVALGIAAAEIVDYGIKKVGKTDKVPDGVGGLVVAAGAAVAKQPAVSIGGLVDTGVVAVRTLTGYDVTKPAEQMKNMTERTADESGIVIAE